VLRLYILRHAKSSWAEPGKRDFDRGLNARGTGDLAAIARMLLDCGLAPAHVFCSPAVRTRLTLQGIVAHGVPSVSTQFVDELYSGDIGNYVDCLKGHARAETVLFVGHNPMSHGFALEMTGDGEPEALRSLASKYPTGALAAIDFDISEWSQARRHGGRLAAFRYPKEG
jgi:phosphohistidine phosphatase